MQQMFPEIRPYAEHQLKVDPPHSLYIAESGIPEGIPVLVIHGGPGAGSAERARRLFDPEVYRIIQYDQRGCGRSVPHASVEQNDLDSLIADIVRIREFLNVEKWLLFGGSWGSTLALAYGQQHPEQVSGFILRGIFLARQQDMDWLYKEGASRIFPEHWQAFTELSEGQAGTPLLQAYQKQLTGPNEIRRMAAAKAWVAWEDSCAKLVPGTRVHGSASDPGFSLAVSSISVHFMLNQCFIREPLLNGIKAIEHLPCTLIHGRYDMVCPLDNAFDLYNCWPEAELDIVREAGHSQFEPGIIDATIKAARAMSERLGQEPKQA